MRKVDIRQGVGGDLPLEEGGNPHTMKRNGSRIIMNGIGINPLTLPQREQDTLLQDMKKRRGLAAPIPENTLGETIALDTLKETAAAEDILAMEGEETAQGL